MSHYKPYLSGLLHSLAFFSRIPISQKFLIGDNSKMVLMLPLVGAIFGIFTILFYEFCSISFSQTYSLVLSFAFFVYLSGGIHLDGFVDTLDGLFAGKERAYIAMRDSRIGALGAIFLILFLILKLFAILELNDIYLFLAAPVLSRASVLMLTLFFRYEKHGIEGNYLNVDQKKEAIFVFLLIALFLILWLGFVGFVILGASMLFAFFVASYLKCYFGELSGDNYGFCLESTEFFAVNLLIFLH